MAACKSTDIITLVLVNRLLCHLKLKIGQHCISTLHYLSRVTNLMKQETQMLQNHHLLTESQMHQRSSSVGVALVLVLVPVPVLIQRHQIQRVQAERHQMDQKGLRKSVEQAGSQTH